MKIIRLIAIMLLGLFLLSGCSYKGGKADDTTNPTNTPIADRVQFLDIPYICREKGNADIPIDVTYVYAGEKLAVDSIVAISEDGEREELNFSEQELLGTLSNGYRVVVINCKVGEKAFDEKHDTKIVAIEVNSKSERFTLDTKGNVKLKKKDNTEQIGAMKWMGSTSALIGAYVFVNDSDMVRVAYSVEDDVEITGFNISEGLEIDKLRISVDDRVVGEGLGAFPIRVKSGSNVKIEYSAKVDEYGATHDIYADTVVSYMCNGENFRTIDYVSVTRCANNQAWIDRMERENQAETGSEEE